MKSRYFVRLVIIAIIFFAFTSVLFSTAPHQESGARDAVPHHDEESLSHRAQQHTSPKHHATQKHVEKNPAEEVAPNEHLSSPRQGNTLGEPNAPPNDQDDKSTPKEKESDLPKHYSFNDMCEPVDESNIATLGDQYSYDVKSFEHGIMMMKPRSTRWEKLNKRGRKKENLFFADDALVIDTNSDEHAVPMTVTKNPALPEGDHSAARSTQIAMRGRKIAFEPVETSKLPRFISGACSLQKRMKKGAHGMPVEDDASEPSQVVQFQYCRTSKMIGDDERDETVGHGQRISDESRASLISPPCMIDAEMKHMSGDGEQLHKFAGKNQANGKQATATTFSFRRRMTFFGFAMRGNGFVLKEGIRFGMKNLDINHYQLSDSLGLYGTVPLVYAVDDKSPEKHTVGIFWLNGATIEAEISKDWMGSKLSIMSSEGGVKVFVLPGPTPKDVLKQYFYLTGKPMLPPYFSTGYHQCRWSYRNQRDVLQVNANFDTKNVPCDAIWLDIDHTDGKRYFTWDKQKFPDPEKMQKTLWNDSRRRMVTITDPHIKSDSRFHVYAEGFKHGYFVNRQDGSGAFHGHCWPGDSVWIDFANPDARDWYATLFDYDRYEGSTKYLFAWNDMNEPSVFSGPDITFPFGVRHYDGTNHGQLHNMYGFYHSMATFSGHLRRSDDEARPFALTRSFFAGSQRYAAVWTGDNQALWSHLKVSVTMVLQMQICGIPFVGADVGGFFDNPTQELILRWYQLGSLYPFFRGHSHEQTPRREPWLTGHAFDDVRKAIQFRYKLLPYMYTAFWESSVKGDGIWRPLMLEFPEDVKGLAVTDTFMVGSSLLARPIVDMWKINGDIKVHFPLGTAWYDYWTGDPVYHDAGSAQLIPIAEHDDNMVTPLWIMAGRIIATKQTVGKSSENHGDHPYVVTVALDHYGEASGILYVDDGESNEFRKSDKYCVVHFTFKRSTLFVEVFNKGAPQAHHNCNFNPQASSGDSSNKATQHIVGNIRILAAKQEHRFTGRVSLLTKGKENEDTHSNLLNELSIKQIDSFGPKSYDAPIEALQLPIVPAGEQFEGLQADSENSVHSKAEMASWSIKFKSSGDEDHK